MRNACRLLAAVDSLSTPKVLRYEAGVGTGRLYVPLLEAGLDVTGFDHSPDMLAVCRRNAETRGLTPKLTQARFQDFALDRAFTAVITKRGVGLQRRPTKGSHARGRPEHRSEQQ